LVLEDVDANISEEDFKKRILSHCITPTEQPTTITDSTDTATADISQIIPVPESVSNALGPEDTSAPAPPASAVQQAAGVTAQPNAQTLQDVMAERNARLEADHQKKRAAEKEALEAARKRAEVKAGKQAVDSNSVPPARQDWLNQQRTRQQEARAEKERILKTIEQDKINRQEREKQRKGAAQIDPTTSVVDGPASFAPQRSDTTNAVSRSATCNLQVRLFDGTSLKSRFDSSATLGAAVRAYVDSQSNTDIPYNFREMRTPNPSRTIEISEENQSLQSLGLTPSATLVLVPVKGYTDAYASSGATGIVAKGFNTGYNIFSGALGLVGNAVGGVLGYGGDAAREGLYMGGTSDEKEPSNVEGSRMAGDGSKSAAGPSSGIKIRTLADQRNTDDSQELYNGNQVSIRTCDKGG